MRLLWSSRSPFARKVTVAAHELGIAELIRDDGSALFDSGVILDYLNGRFGGALVPPPGEARWAALRLQALGDGLAQLNRGRLAEGRRGEHASPVYGEAFATKSAATLDRLDTEAAGLEPVTVASIAVAVALAHLDFRFPRDGWRTGRPLLASWFEAFSQRPSMRATEPEDVY